MRTTPSNIISLAKNEIFVFGSNEASIHGAGAAKIAHEKFGAAWLKGWGLEKKTFAIPTKDWNIQTLPVSAIEFYVHRFIAAADYYSYYTFLVTEIGCGLAGYTPEQIAPLFSDALRHENIILPQSFIKTLQNEKTPQS